MTVSTLSKDNLTELERDALKSLSSRSDIVIREADKGGSVVVLDSEEYNREALRQLEDTTTYCTLHTNPTNLFKTQLSSYLDSGVEMGVLTLKLNLFLLTIHLSQLFTICQNSVRTLTQCRADQLR